MSVPEPIARQAGTMRAVLYWAEPWPVPWRCRRSAAQSPSWGARKERSRFRMAKPDPARRCRLRRRLWS